MSTPAPIPAEADILDCLDRTGPPAWSTGTTGPADLDQLAAACLDCGADLPTAARLIAARDAEVRGDDPPDPDLITMVAEAISDTAASGSTAPTVTTTPPPDTPPQPAEAPGVWAELEAAAISAGSDDGPGHGAEVADLDAHRRSRQQAAVQQDGATQVEVLLAMAAGTWRLAAGTHGADVAIPHAPPRVAIPLKGRGGAMSRLVAMYMAANGGKPPGGTARADAAVALAAQAEATPATTIPIRVAARPDGHPGSVIDLGRPDGLAVTIGADGWHVAPLTVPMRRSRLTAALPLPEQAATIDDLDRLWSIVNIAPADRALTLAWLTAGTLPDRPRPVLAVVGGYGSAKTSSARTLAGLVDPTPEPAELLRRPKDERDYATLAAAKHLVAFDNLRGISEELSDAIAISTTGGADVRRELYTDSDVAIVPLTATVLFTTISGDMGMSGDLASRTLRLALPPIPDHLRREDGEVRAEREAAMPHLLGGLYTLTSAVLARLPQVHPPATTRMADFHRIAATVDAVLGLDGDHSAAGRYGELLAGLSADVLADHPFTGAVVTLMSGRDRWSGTAADLVAAVTPPEWPHGRPPIGWPGNAVAAGIRLTNAVGDLARVGIQAVRPPGGDRVWTLVRITDRDTDADG